MPSPECNLVIGDDDGPIGRVDLVYLKYKLIIEYRATSIGPIAVSGIATSIAKRISHVLIGR